jgi:hypothetical protein
MIEFFYIIRTEISFINVIFIFSNIYKILINSKMMSNVEKVQRTLPYPMHVASAVIRPDDINHWKNNIVLPQIEYRSEILENNKTKYYRSKDMLERLKNIKTSDIEASKSIDEIIKLHEANHNLTLEELKRSIIDQFVLETINRSTLYHVPAINSEYHIYKNERGGSFISLIGPTEWNKYSEYLGSFVNKKTHFEISYLKPI